MNEKRKLRQEIKEKLGTLAKPIYEDNSFRIAQNLYTEEDWKKARLIGVTISSFPEVDTYQIIRKAWEEGKEVAVPKCIPEDRQLVFRKLSSFAQLESSFFGLYEPIEAKTEAISHEEIDLLIVPGLAFVKEGYRLGFGGGYYDRFLEKYNGETLSLAFNMQIVPNLPLESHDIPVKKIITPNEVVICDR